MMIKALHFTFKVHLKNLAPNANFGEGDMYEIGNQLTTLFDQVVEASSGYTNSDFSWNSQRKSILEHELLCYFLPNQAASLIAKNRRGSNLGTGRGGNTTLNIPVISEIYLDVVMKFANYHLLIAKLCFHEFMHNKLSPLDIHVHGGGGLATSGEITTSTLLEPKNIELMSKALWKKRLQFLGAL